MKDLRQNITEMVDQSYALSFACVDGDKPYQVWMHYAGDLNTIIVYSRRDRVHSEFVRANNAVSIAVLPQQNPGAPVRALSGQGVIRELTDEAAIKTAHATYVAKFVQHDAQELLRQSTSGQTNEHAFWEIKMNTYV